MDYFKKEQDLEKEKALLVFKKEVQEKLIESDMRRVKAETESEQLKKAGSNEVVIGLMDKVLEMVSRLGNKHDLW